jgi:excisionase family DNA binding protein
VSRRAYTVASLAAEWDCSEGSIRKLIASEQLGHFRIGNLIRIPAEEVSRFECQNTPFSDSEAATPSSIETTTDDATASDFVPRTVLGLRRKRDGDGPRGPTVHHGPWAASSGRI